MDFQQISTLENEQESYYQVYFRKYDRIVGISTNLITIPVKHFLCIVIHEM